MTSHYVVEIEDINLPTDSVNLETVLPMIDHTDICSFVITEVRRQIVKKNVSTFSSLFNPYKFGE